MAYWHAAHWHAAHDTGACNPTCWQKELCGRSRQHAHLSHGHYPVVSTSVWQLLLFAVRLYKRLQAVDAVAAAVTPEPAPQQRLGTWYITCEGMVVWWDGKQKHASGMTQLATQCYDNRSTLVTAAVPCCRAHADNPLHELHDILTADCWCWDSRHDAERRHEIQLPVVRADQSEAWWLQSVISWAAVLSPPVQRKLLVGDQQQGYNVQSHKCLLYWAFKAAAPNSDILCKTCRLHSLLYCGIPYVPVELQQPVASAEEHLVLVQPAFVLAHLQKIAFLLCWSLLHLWHQPGIASGHQCSLVL